MREPADSPRQIVDSVQLKDLDQHHLDEIFPLKNTPGLRIANDHHHALQITLQCSAVERVFEMDDRWKDFQQQVGVLAGKSE